ncbi:hypothetical protein SUGI_0267950 [Cryptomeria japonica]|nr:hypothetical protein SUGI_0267950 [Cryptomeria japonica]
MTSRPLHKEPRSIEAEKYESSLPSYGFGLFILYLHSACSAYIHYTSVPPSKGKYKYKGCYSERSKCSGLHQGSQDTMHIDKE